MLLDSELKELREELLTAKKPLIFFDDDTDGLSSFLLYYKFVKGYAEDVKGIPVKDNPELKSEIFLNKITEFNPDKVFILDKPLISQDFLDKIKVKAIWLDHHPMVERSNVVYYNPLKHKSKEYTPDNRPTTYWAYKTVEEDIGKDNMWIAMVGCVGDWFIPEFYKEFSEKYPDLLPPDLKIRNPGTVLHETKLGKLCRILQFNLKQSSNEAMKSVKIMTRITDPYEILEQRTPQGKFIYKQYEKINSIYEGIKSQVKITEDRVILFEYEEKHAMTGDLSNEIQYYNPDKLIIIARRKGDDMVCSLRSENIIISDILKKSLVGIDGHGGGHEHACGACVKKADFPRFIENIHKHLPKK